MVVEQNKLMMLIFLKFSRVNFILYVTSNPISFEWVLNAVQKLKNPKFFSLDNMKKITLPKHVGNSLKRMSARVAIQLRMM